MKKLFVISLLKKHLNISLKRAKQISSDICLRFKELPVDLEEKIINREKRFIMTNKEYTNYYSKLEKKNNLEKELGFAKMWNKYHQEDINEYIKN